VILHDATLAEIAHRQPRDLAALEEIPGIGARKLERYGPALLDLLAGPETRREEYPETRAP